MAVKIQDRVGGKKKTNPTSADRLRPRDDTRPKDWSPYVNNNTSSKKTSSNLTDRGYPSSKSPTSQPKKMTSTTSKSTESAYEKRLRDLHKNDDRPGKPTSSSTKAQQRNNYILHKAFNEKTTKKTSRNAEAAIRGYTGRALREKGEEKRYVSGEEYDAYRQAKNRAQKDSEASRIAEAERRAAAGEPLRAKGEEKRYVSGAEYEAYRKAKNKAKKK